VGRLVPCKRLPLLFETFARVRREIPEARLVIVGPTEAQAAPLAERCGVRQRSVFAGRVVHEELPRYYRACDVYVHTSAYEGLGLAMLEAALSARPVVSTPTGGAAEIVADGRTGYLVDGVEALAARVTGLLRDPEKAREMGLRGREEAAAKFDWEAGIRTVVERWRELAGGRA
jgi:phosphatidylinositol alpha-1,6-mannosyltransferase